MILAAGLGTRLKPLTDSMPKAMVPLAGKPLLYYVIERLKHVGVTQIIINVHHFARSIIDYVESNNNFGIQIAFSREETLLDTGGGLKNASWFFPNDPPFILHNVDVLSEINIKEMLNYHQKKESLVTLAVRKRKTSRYFLFDEEGKLNGWQSLETGEEEIVSHSVKKHDNLSFMGLHIISPQIFSFLPNKRIFSIVKAYLDLAKQGQKIYGYRNDHDFWLDLGRKENLLQAEKYLTEKKK